MSPAKINDRRETSGSTREASWTRLEFGRLTKLLSADLCEQA